MVSKDIQVEEGLGAEGAHQPNSQMDFPDVGTDSGPWGWWALCAALSPPLIYPFNAPHLNPEGLHMGQNGLSGTGGTAEEAGPIAWPAGSETLVKLGARWGFFIGGWDGTGWEYDVTPLKSP